MSFVRFPGYLPAALLNTTTHTRVFIPEEPMVSISGEWRGEIDVQGVQLEIIVRFDRAGDDGSISGTIDIPPQNAFGLALTQIRIGDPSAAAVSFQLPAGPAVAVFDGLLVTGTDGVTQIRGSFTQGGVVGSFSLERSGDAETATDDAAEPIGQAVTLDRPGVTLHGTLITPPDAGSEAPQPWPLVVIVSGSGPTDRDGNSAMIPGKNDGLRRLAEGLSAAGYATLRYDKRGIGESVQPEMSEADLSFDDFINDLLGWLAWGAADERFSWLVPAGHSEGGLIAPAAVAAPLARYPGLDADTAGAARPDVTAVVTIAAAGRSIDEVVLSQLRPQLESSNPDLWERTQDILQALAQGRFVDDPPAELASLFRRSVQPFLMSEMAYDPAALSAALPVPHLVISGEEDLQVTAEDAQLLAQPESAEHLRIAGMNHVLKDVPAGDAQANQRAYADPAFDLPAELVPAIGAFLQQRGGE